MGEHKHHTALLKKGVWIKEQQGSLTIGSLDETGKNVMVIPDALSSQLFAFEDDMIEALYGENRQVFDPFEMDMDDKKTAGKKPYFDIMIPSAPRS